MSGDHSEGCFCAACSRVRQRRREQAIAASKRAALDVDETLLARVLAGERPLPGRVTPAERRIILAQAPERVAAEVFRVSERTIFRWRSELTDHHEPGHRYG